jgi:hypothetical protein
VAIQDWFDPGRRACEPYHTTDSVYAVISRMFVSLVINDDRICECELYRYVGSFDHLLCDTARVRRLLRVSLCFQIGQAVAATCDIAISYKHCAKKVSANGNYGGLRANKAAGAGCGAAIKEIELRNWLHAQGARLFHLSFRMRCFRAC